MEMLVMAVGEAMVAMDLMDFTHQHLMERARIALLSVDLMDAC
jgi:hypothetical protein